MAPGRVAARRAAVCPVKRYHGSGHPIVASFEPGEGWRRCYADELLVKPIAFC